MLGKSQEQILNPLPEPVDTQTEGPVIEGNIVASETKAAQAQGTAGEVNAAGEVNIKNSEPPDPSENPPMVSNVEIVPPPNVTEESKGHPKGSPATITPDPLRAGQTLGEKGKKKSVEDTPVVKHSVPSYNPDQFGDKNASSNAPPVTTTLKIDNPSPAHQSGGTPGGFYFQPPVNVPAPREKPSTTNPVGGPLPSAPPLGNEPIVPVVTTTSAALPEKRGEGVPRSTLNNPPSDTDTYLKLQRDADAYKYKRNLKIWLSALYVLTIAGGGVAAFFFWPIILPSAAAFVASVLAVYAAYYVGVALLTLLGAFTGTVLFAILPIGIHRLANRLANGRYPNSSAGPTLDPALPGGVPAVRASHLAEEEIFPSTPGGDAVLPGKNPKTETTEPLVEVESDDDDDDEDATCFSSFQSIGLALKKALHIGERPPDLLDTTTTSAEDSLFSTISMWASWGRENKIPAEPKSRVDYIGETGVEKGPSCKVM